MHLMYHHMTAKNEEDKTASLRVEITTTITVTMDTSMTTPDALPKLGITIKLITKVMVVMAMPLKNRLLVTQLWRTPKLIHQVETTTELTTYKLSPQSSVCKVVFACFAGFMFLAKERLEIFFLYKL